MSKPSTRTKTAGQKPPKNKLPPTHVFLPLEDAQRMFQLLGEVPVKYGVAWVIDTLRKAPQGMVNATAPPAPPAAGTSPGGPGHPAPD